MANGQTCQYCPDGHKRSDEITAANAGKAYAINIHAGGYATAGPPTFITTDGTAIHNTFTLTISGYPCGTVNRGAVQAREQWSGTVNTTIGQDAYVNIAGEAILDSNARTLTVNLEAYYTANSPASTNYVTVALLQDNILASQTGGSTYYPAMMVGSKYRHMHALRDVLTAGSTGEVTGVATTSGTKYTKTINYTVPTDIGGYKVVAKDLSIVAFISETTKKVINVCKVPISYGTPTSVNDKAASSNSLSIYPNPSNGLFNASFEAKKADNYVIKISNAIGQVVFEESLNNFSGVYNKELNISSFGQGVYLFSVSSSDGEQVKQVINY